MEDFALIRRVGGNLSYEVMAHRAVKKQVLDLLGRFGSQVLLLQKIEEDPGVLPGYFYQSDIAEFVLPHQKLNEPKVDRRFEDDHGVTHINRRWDYDKQRVQAIIRVEAEDSQDPLRIDIFDSTETADSKVSPKLVKALREIHFKQMH